MIWVEIMLSTVIKSWNYNLSPNNYAAISPIIIIGLFALFVLIAELIRPNTKISYGLSIVGILSSVLDSILLLVVHTSSIFFSNSLKINSSSLALNILFLISALIVVLISGPFNKDSNRAEYLFLILCAVFPMMFLGTVQNLLALYICMEALAIPGYLLVGWNRDLKAGESSIKFYILGVLASALILYGISLIFGLVGSTNFGTITQFVLHIDKVPPALMVALIAILGGLGFKISAMPFHFWAPDAYEGAPVAIAAFLSVASKAAGFVVLVILVVELFSPLFYLWQGFLAIVATLTMLGGALAALRQTNVLRFVAYSSIAQSGFILTPLVISASKGGLSKNAIAVSFLYLGIYVISNLGVFVVISLVRDHKISTEINSYRGLYSRSPLLAFCLSIFLFSLAGIPPLGGWFAKFDLFSVVFKSGSFLALFLGFVALVSSVISLVYYAKIVRILWEEKQGLIIKISLTKTNLALGTALVVCAGGVVISGLYPQLFINWANLIHFVA